MAFKESDFSKKLAASIDKNQLPDLITNLASYENKINVLIQNVENPNTSTNLFTILQYNIAKNIAQILELIYDLELIGEEYVLLNTGTKRGKQPSADIIAINNIYNNIFIFELKKSHNTARESVTELSAYTQGFNKTFQFLPRFQTIWCPIITDWRVTVIEALKYQMIHNNIYCLPLIANLTPKLKASELDIELEIFDLIETITSNQIYSLLSFACFEGCTISYAKDKVNRSEMSSIIKRYCEKNNMLGFCYFNVPDYEINIPFPESIVVIILNPFKSLLKKEELDFLDAIEVNEEVKRRRIGDDINGQIDLNFITREKVICGDIKPRDMTQEEFQNIDFNELGYLFEEEIEDKERFYKHSIFNEYASFHTNSFNSLIEESTRFIKFYVDTIEMNDVPDLKDRLNKDAISQLTRPIEVEYFGLFSDLAKEYILHNSKIREEMSFISYSKFSLLLKILNENN